MTLFKILLHSSGMSTREAAEFLDVSTDSVKNWCAGKREAPTGVIVEMRHVVQHINDCAGCLFSTILPQLAGASSEPIRLPTFPDDDSARNAGLYFNSNNDALLRRVIEDIPAHAIHRIVLEGK